MTFDVTKMNFGIENNSFMFGHADFADDADFSSLMFISPTDFTDDADFFYLFYPFTF